MRFWRSSIRWLNSCVIRYLIGKGGKEGDKDYHKKIACDGDNCWLWIKVIPGLDKFFEKIIALEEKNIP